MRNALGRWLPLRSPGSLSRLSAAELTVNNGQLKLDCEPLSRETRRYVALRNCSTAPIAFRRTKPHFLATRFVTLHDSACPRWCVKGPTKIKYNLV